MANKATWKRIREADERWEEAIRLAERGLSINEICARLNVSRTAYDMRRQRHRDWYARFKTAQNRALRALRRYDGTFASFRLHYLGMETLPFMHRVCDAIEAAQPGEVTLILIPPGHAKTTLIEDWCTYKIINDNSYRIVVGSETVDHCRKILARVRDRLEDDGPMPAIAEDFGPFSPREGNTAQPWSATHFNVAGKRGSDERDYTMNCVGLTGRVQGSRCDLLILDDIQDVKSLDRSDKYYDIVVQSFLSRPEMFGRTVILGTRVGEFDVYRKLIDNGIYDHLVLMPAYDAARSPTWNFDPNVKPRDDDASTWPPGGMRFLWGPDPDAGTAGRYTPLQYAKLRFRVGERAWARNYMQRPEAASSMTFNAEVTDHLKDETRGIWVDPTPPDGGGRVPVVLSLDPAVGGGNAVGAGAMYPNRLEVLHCRLDYDLTSYAQIFTLLGTYASQYTTANSFIAECVIEDKAFQKGLLTDDALIELQRRYGFRIVPNTTGKEKVDTDIGVPGMEFSMRRGEITVPYASPEAVKAMQPLFDHLHMWRPGVNGVKLPQDMVMMLWFMWRRWKAYRDTPLHTAPTTTEFNSRPSPLRRRGYRPLVVR